MTITDNIRRLREENNLTQEAMAERLNTTRSNYAYLENRGEKLTVEQVRTIAKALNRSVSDLLEDAKDPLNKKELALISNLETEIQDLKSANRTLRNSLDAYHMMLKTIQEELVKEEANLEQAFAQDSLAKNALEKAAENLLANPKLQKIVKPDSE